MASILKTCILLLLVVILPACRASNYVWLMSKDKTLKDRSAIENVEFIVIDSKILDDTGGLSAEAAIDLAHEVKASLNANTHWKTYTDTDFDAVSLRETITKGAVARLQLNYSSKEMEYRYYERQVDDFVTGLDATPVVSTKITSPETGETMYEAIGVGFHNPLVRTSKWKRNALSLAISESLSRLYLTSFSITDEEE